MNIEYIIIQAGGEGTRLEHLTRNKPKALVPIENLPMVFHLFKKFPDKKYIIIGDYKIEVLRKYLEAFSEVKHIIVNAAGEKGTCAGLQNAIKNIPKDKAFMLIWSDLVLADDFEMPTERENYIGISKDFRCRWSYSNAIFQEKPSTEYGVAGMFIFQAPEELKKVPKEGEFVRWLQRENRIFDCIPLHKTKEYGLLNEYKIMRPNRCRPFNKITVFDEKIVKEGIDKQGEELAIRERQWYSFVKKLGFDKTPQIYQYTPLIMDKINGKNIFEYSLNKDEQKLVLKKIVGMLNELHSLKREEVNYFSIWNNYYDKTFDRLNKVQNLIPFALEKEILINGKKCRNIFFHKEVVSKFMESYKIESFKLIHGDCTFSNLLLKNNSEPIMIDPRGYFGYTELFGDENYDWAKIYYSIVGDYDQFNLKRFSLEIKDTGVNLQIETNGWKDLEEYFFGLLEMDQTQKINIKMIHAVIWLSLTTYAWEDYDSICGAFYNGLLYFEEVANEIL